MPPALADLNVYRTMRYAHTNYLQLVDSCPIETLKPLSVVSF